MRIGQDFFSGERPRTAEHLAKSHEAQMAQNCDLLRGDLRPLKSHSKIQDFADATPLLSLYHWKTANAGDHWIAHGNDLDFARSPVAAEAHSRTYVTGMTEPRVLTTSIMSGPFEFTTDYYKLGVPAPTAALTIGGAYTAGSGYRAYIYTYVVKLGASDAEEGPNSAVVSVSNYGSGNVTLSGFTEPPTQRSIGKIRIYRTSSGTSGVGEFLFVGEFDTDGVDFASYTFIDNVADADLEDALVTENWSPPPADLKGLIALKNGAIAGFSGNRVYISEPFLPHAWPYSYPVDATIVGLGMIGSTITVLTDESPYLMEGQPEAITTQKLAGRYPCVSKRGIVSCEIGVLYPSDEGVAQVTYDGVTLLTYEYLTRSQYEASFSPTTTQATYYNGMYFAFHGGGCFGINTRDKTLSEVNDPVQATASHVSLVDNRLYFIAQGDDATPNALFCFSYNSSESYLQYRYISNDQILPTPSNLSTARIVPAPEAMANDANQAINDAIIAATAGQGLVDGGAVNVGGIWYDGLQKVYACTLKLYADGTLLHTKTITNGEPFRLPGERLYRRCYYELTGDFPIARIDLATSMEELNAA